MTRREGTPLYVMLAPEKFDAYKARATELGWSLKRLVEFALDNMPMPPKNPEVRFAELEARVTALENLK